ncbi:nucleotidyltransferase [Candidatus Woesearchaeota archaeon]|nr:nucleotidyltransferase [Candidatus Woesearchaeota archaeon]|tara:strand:+ start:402 stop:1256 length:855 start_codon:yes stop_codon:yes gene_type:complete
MKERITITLDSELIKQIDKRIDGTIMKNRSQQIELLLTKSLGTYRPEKAVILVGGKGTRLRPLTYKTPKCMLEIQGKTLTEHLFDLLKKYGIRDIIMSVGYMKEKVKDYYGDGSKFGVNIEYVEEDEPLGTAGPLKLAKNMLHDSFLVTNGDELKNINIPRMFGLHKRKDTLGTIALTTVTDPSLYGVAKLSGSRILEFVEKPKPQEAPSNLINAGFYILEPKVIDMIPDGFSMLEQDIFPKLAKQGSLRGFPFAGQWFDIGNLERYEIAKKRWGGISLHDENE